MLTILYDPAGIAGSESHELDYTISLQANIERHMEGGAGCELRINGLVVDPLTDPRMDACPSILDRVVVIRRPEGLDPVTWIAIISFVLSVAAVAMMPGVPDPSAGQNESPNNKLTGQSNIARTYQAIPDVYGYRRVWPDLIQPSTVEYIDHLKYVTEWLCISRGKGTLTDVQYAETPIGDIEGSSYEAFEPVPVDGYPEFGTTTLDDVYEAFDSPEVNGQEIPYPTPMTTVIETGDLEAVVFEYTFTATFVDGPEFAELKARAPEGYARIQFTLDGFPYLEDVEVLGYVVVGADVTFTFGRATPWISGYSEPSIGYTITPYEPVTLGPFTLPVDCTRLWWNVIFLRGLDASVDIKTEWWQVDSGGVEVPGTRQDQTDTYTEDTLDQRFFTEKVTPTAGSGRYRMQFTRLTPQQGSQGTDVAKLEEVYAVRYHATKELPGVTVLRVTTKATLSATGFSDRKFNLRWQRHVRTLADDTLTASRNFARAIAHIWTIAGNDISGLDITALAGINTEFGSTSELLRFDGSLDDVDMSLGERMQYVANTARCVIWRDGTKWTATRDQARDIPELQLDYRNLASDGESGIVYAAHLPASFDGIELEYVDETTQAKKSYIRLDINSGAPVVGASSNPKKIKLLGCTTTSQAENRAYLEANRLLYQRVSVKDTALAEANTLGIGSLVRWIDPNDFAGDDGLQAGEVMAIDGLTITTSEELDFKGEASGRILFTGEDGAHLGTPIVCTPAAGGCTLASLPAGLYVADTDRQLGSRYAFAVGLTVAEVEASGLYTVAEVRPASVGKVTLSMANYDERIYGDD
jgi:hypothetical protein